MWDIGLPPPSNYPLPVATVDTVLAIFTLSALPPEALPHAFSHLAACLAPGGSLLLRDYGRLDLKQIKFASTLNGRLGSGHGCEWYSRGDGTTALFFTTEAVRELAEAAGLRVESARYDRRLTVNRASKTQMHRVWVVAELRKPGGGGTGGGGTGGGGAGGGGAGGEEARGWWRRGVRSIAPIALAVSLVLAVAVVGAASSRWRRGLS